MAWFLNKNGVGGKDWKPKPSVGGTPDSPKNGEDWTIDLTVADLIGQAKPGSFIYISMPGFKEMDSKIIPALKMAIENRGVHVLMVTERENVINKDFWGVHPDVLAALKKTFDKDSKSSIRGFKKQHPTLKTNNINHNKFILFEELDGTLRDGSKVKGQWIVGQSSANWNGNFFNAARRPQDLILIQNKGLYKAYRKYFIELCNFGKPLVKDNNPSEVESGYESSWSDQKSGLEVHFGPFKQTQDPIVNLLKSLTCTRQGVIRVAMAHWNGTRGRSIADLLKTKQKSGCQVHILAGWKADKEDGYKISSSRNLPVAKTAAHTKMMLIEGMLDSAKNKKKILVTGSANWQDNVLVGNNPMADTVLMIENDSNIYQQYKEYWTWMCKHEAWDKINKINCNPLPKQDIKLK